MIKVPNLSQNSVQRLEDICSDIEQWPKSWAGADNDVIVGKIIIIEFKRYLNHLINKGRTKVTIKKHADYLWAMGGEIIRDTNEYGVDECLSSKELLLKYINDSGGPYWRHTISESDTRHYDATCRQLYGFLIRKT